MKIARTVPKAESVHFLSVVTERRVPIWISLQIKLDKLFQISPDNLISVDKNDFVHVKRKHDVEKEDFVAPHGSLLLPLGIQPSRPLTKKMNNEYLIGRG